MTYNEALPLSWALAWRLVVSHLVLALIFFMLILAFGSPHRGFNAQVIGVGNALLGWFIAWPFAIRRVLAPATLLPGATLNRTFQVRYKVAVTLGVACDLICLVPVAAAMLLMRTAALGLALFLLIRLFVVLPLGIQRLARRLPEIA